MSAPERKNVLGSAAMTGTEIGLVISVFIACTVEAVEALTIVLAVGATRSWRSAMTGVGVALLALAAVTAALGPALTALPIKCSSCRCRWPTARLRVAMAAQGDLAGERAEGPA